MSEFNFKKYLKEGRLLKENTLAQNLRDEAKHPDSKVGASIFNKYAKKIENSDKADYKKIIKAMESELISKHPDTFSGEDDIPGSFTENKLPNKNKSLKEDREAEEMAVGMPPRAGSERDKRAQDKGSYMMSDPSIGSKINDIINTLNSIEVDGETMEYILQKTGMDEQMLKQLAGALKESENDEGNYQLTDTKDEPINIGDIVWRFRLGNEPDDFAYYKGDTKEEAISKIPPSVKNDPYVRRKMQGGSLVGGFGKSFEIKSGSDLEDLKYDMERGFLDDVFDSVDEGRHYYGAGMDDEYDEEPRSSRSRYGRGNSSAYERGTAIPKRYTYQDEEEEEIEFVKGKDYEAQNQRVLRNMDESKFDKALKSASTKLKEGKKNRR